MDINLAGMYDTLSALIYLARINGGFFRKQILVFWMSFLLLVLPVSQVLSKEKVTFLPQWIPQAQFAGYMVAKEKGFYNEWDLDVTLLRGGPDINPFFNLAARETTFCSGWLSEGIQQRASGIEVVNLAQIIQQSSLLLIAKKERHIDTLADLNGRKVGFWMGEFYMPIRALIFKHDLNVKLVPNYTTVTILLKDAVDAMAAMWYNEYHRMILSGYNPDELSVFRFSELGVDFPEDGIYCLEKTYLSNPVMCENFVRASLKGWQYAFTHEEETLDIVMAYADAANTGTNRAHQRWMLARMKDLVLDSDTPGSFGILDRDDYRKLGQTLERMYMIDEVPEFDLFFKGWH
ncbi:MAG: ABC transporter substrate-binding protein [Desulfotignum sp.]|nr:ABC transporter substrate-binding protein [Desulfotignum sp.]MCF8126184.1 ABC transporter substrate-binding protein [Desulfotignum sp.]